MASPPDLGVDDGIAFALQHRLDQAALGRIVVDDQDGLGHVRTPFVITVGRLALNARLARFGTF